MWSTFRLTSVLAAFALWLPVLAWSADERRALVIGNGNYVHGQRLANTLNDAADMCQVLKQLGYETDCFVNVQDKAAFEARVQEFVARLNPQSKGLFYYAGHAVQLNGESYLVPVQAEVRNAADVRRELLPVQQVLDLLKAAGNSFNMVVLDACRDDLFAEAPVVAAASRRGILTARKSPEAAGEQAVAYGLATIRDAPVGSIVLYATASREAAYDGEGRNGPLTKHLLAHIREPGIPVEELIKRVTVGVQTETKRAFGRRQTPFVYSSFTGEFCFADCTPPVNQRDVERSREQAKPWPQVHVPPSL
jgi:uncharacterized caspase-like protein